MLGSVETQNRIFQIVGSGEHCILYGEPGTGKSSFVRKASEAAGISLHALPITRGCSGQSLFALIAPDSKGMWQRLDGPCTRAAREGGILLLDDLHVAGPDVESAIYSAADRHSIELPWGEVITPHTRYQVIATSNVGPEKLAPAIRSRFAIEIAVNGILPQTVETMPAWARNLLASLPDSAPGAPIDTRNVWASIRLAQKFGRATALDLVFGTAQGKEIETACLMAERK